MPLGVSQGGVLRERLYRRRKGAQARFVDDGLIFGAPWLVVLFSLGVAGATAAEPSRGTACDPDVVGAQAEKDYPEYRVEAGRGDGGVVTLRFVSRDGDGVFAIALRAAGTTLSTSIAADRMDDAELRRVGEPVATWWQNARLLRTLAACTAAVPDSVEVDLRTAARTALRPKIRDSPPSRLRLLFEWIAPRERLTLLFGLAWIAFAALLLPELLQCARSRAQRAALLALSVCSLALNAHLCVGGPGDLRLSLAPIWWRGVPELRWGPAPVGFFRLLEVVLGGIDDSRIRSANAVLSSLVPVVTYAIIAELGVATMGALLAAFVIAGHPFFIAFSADLGRQPTFLFAAFGSNLGLIGFLKRGQRRTLVTFLLGTILAITSRPEGVHVLALNAAILLFVPTARPRRATAGTVLALLAGLAFVYARYLMTYGRECANDTSLLSSDAGAPLWTVTLSPDFTPFAWIVAWTIGLVVGIRRRAAWVALFVLMALHVAWSATPVYASFVGYDRQVASTRYQSVLLLPYGVGTALLVDSLLAFGTRVTLTAIALLTVFTVATYGRAYDTLLTPFTVDYEYRFLRRHILTLPSEARVYVLEAPANDVGFVDARFVGLFVRPDVEFDAWNLGGGEALPSGVETYLYIGSACAPLVDQRYRPLGAQFQRWLSDCSLLRARLTGNAVEEIDVPAHKMAWYDFTQPTVRLGLYRLPAHRN